MLLGKKFKVIETKIISSFIFSMGLRMNQLYFCSYTAEGEAFGGCAISGVVKELSSAGKMPGLEKDSFLFLQKRRG